MKLLEQIQHFESLQRIHAIPVQQLYLYYFVLLLIYLLFLRGLKPTYLTATLFLLMNQGFFESLLGSYGVVAVKLSLAIFVIILLFKTRLGSFSSREQLLLWLFFAFSILFYLGYALNRVNLIWATYQYFKYAFPFAVYFILKGLNFDERQFEYYSKLLFKLLLFQVGFSIVKILVFGLRENITGSIANAGGGVGIGFAVMGSIAYWASKRGEFNAKDWRFLLFLLIIPAASNKRAIWFLFPIIFTMLLWERMSKSFIRNLFIIILVVPLLVYIGFRFNPSLNPEKKIWGSFDPDFAVDYALNYSGVSEEKLDEDYAQGRWGSAVAIVKATAVSPFSRDALMGYARGRSGGIGSDFRSEDYGLRPGTMISRLGIMIIQMGWPASLLIIIIFIMLIYSIPDRRIANVISFYVLWDTLLYSGSMIESPTQSVLLVYCIWLIRYYKHKHKKETNILMEPITEYKATPRNRMNLQDSFG